jgi:hypothetical protein
MVQAILSCPREVNPVGSVMVSENNDVVQTYPLESDRAS